MAHGKPVVWRIPEISLEVDEKALKILEDALHARGEQILIYGNEEAGQMTENVEEVSADTRGNCTPSILFPLFNLCGCFLRTTLEVDLYLENLAKKLKCLL